MSDAMAPGGLAGAMASGMARDPASPIEGRADARRIGRWTRAWEDRHGDHGQAGPGPDLADPVQSPSPEDRPTRAQPEVACDAPPGPRSLADWRSRHARHSTTPGPQRGDGAPPLPACPRDAGPLDPSDGALLSAALPAGSLQPVPLAGADLAADRSSPSGPGAAQELRSLVESCCTRLLVAPAGAAAAPGVLLDLGRWMPGCSIEVARSAGVLRITLRGAMAGRQGALVQGLDRLRDELALALGCPVLVAVEGQGRGALP